MAPPGAFNTRGHVPYTPSSDALDRHGFGVSKQRKTASAGGGRTWSEDEEVYLLQTRLQKLPYKHIAAHLKKTELACRLHYHQLSHGYNRRKRAASTSSSPPHVQSPVLPPLSLVLNRESSSRDVTPPRRVENPVPSSPENQDQEQLPLSPPGANVTPRPCDVLPKPVEMALSTCSSTLDSPSTMANSTRFLDPPSPKPLPLWRAPSLRLDCVLPPPLTQIDLPRLQAIYATHRSSFWGAITTDYGAGVSPIVLEQAWIENMLTGGSRTPITPLPSPSTREKLPDMTRISSILDVREESRRHDGKEDIEQVGEEGHVEL